MKDDIVLLLSYPDTPLKLSMLRDLIAAVRKTPYPIALATHLPVPESIIKTVDYHIYDADDRPGEDFTVYYHHMIPGEVAIKTKRDSPYHALSGLSSIKNGVTALLHKTKNIHYFEHDSMLDFGAYIKFMSSHLKKKKFVGMTYSVPAQKLHGIVGNFFSVNAKWYDSHMPEIDTWAEYKTYACNQGDYLMAENWLHNFFVTHDMMKDCYFLSKAEQAPLSIKGDVKTIGDKEPGLYAYLSETADHRLMFLAHLYCPEGRSLSIVVDHNGRKDPIYLNGGVLYWRVIEKSGRISVSSALQSHSFVIDPAKEYTETTFKFDDNRILCLKEQ